MRRTIPLGLILALCGLLGGTLTTPARAASTPTKQTVMVPMRDGIRLAIDIRLPAGDGPWPVALTRTPYGKQFGTGDVWPVAQFAQNGIVVVVQDVRGRHASEGKALPYVDDGWGVRQDGFDTVAWIRQQPWCNGKVATFGGSYQGINQLLLAGSGPEGMVGQIVTAGGGSAYHVGWFQDGVWVPEASEGWLNAFGWPAEALQQIKQHPRYDALWATVDLAHRPDQIRWPVVLIGGWYDWALQGTLDAFTLLQDRSAEETAARPRLVVGPWTHGGTMVSSLPSFDRRASELLYPPNSVYPRDAPTQMQWLRHWLTGQPSSPANEPAVRYYVMGDVTDPKAPGNVWRTADRWPPPSRPLRLYFTAEGGLDRQPTATPSVREYDYDPLRPVPTLGDKGNGDGSVDQRRTENWPDVLLFTTPPLIEPLEVTGRITVRLAAATSARDTDFTAKLTDVYPDGRSMLVADGIVRASYRNSVEKAEFLTPNQRYTFDIDLWSTSLVFNRGHRIRVAISSSNYPRFEANRNNGKSWPTDQNFPSVVAHQTIFLGGAEGSSIVLPEVVTAGQ